MKSFDSISPAFDVSSHFLDDELLLFSENQQRIYRLNTTAAFIWCCLEEQQSFNKIVQSLVESFKIARDVAQSDVQNILNEWKASALIVTNNSETPPIPKFEQERLPPLKYDLPIPLQTPDCDQYFYQLVDTCFKVRFAKPGIAEKVVPILKHLESPTHTQIDVVLDVVQNEQHYVLLLDGQAIDYCAEREGLAPMMHANILMVAYERSDCLLAIHAGAITKGEACMLLPAVSGSGKSTLTAALLNEGYGYCTDDLALLSHSDHRIQPAPVSLGLKQGAWPVLRSIFPQIEELAIHRRADDKLIRYLPPPANTLVGNVGKAYPVNCIVFPAYQANTPAILSPLSSAQALCQLTEAGYDLSGGLSKMRVDELVGWISSIDCYALKYDQLSDAIKNIHLLL